MKHLKQYPFLILWGLGTLGSLGLGVRQCILRADGEAVKTYLTAHEDAPFWADLMPDRFLTGEEISPVGEDFEASGAGEEGAFEIQAEPITAQVPGSDIPGNTEEAGQAGTYPEQGENMAGSDTASQTAAEPGTGAEDPQPAYTTGTYFDETYNLWMANAAVYETYEPRETDSPYYRDRGLIPLTPDYGFTEVEDDYFADAAFVGDSRMLGLHDYSGWSANADFYCENGFSVYRWTKGAKTTLQGADRKGKGTQVDLREAFENKTYGKVYLLAGMNDLGYGNTEFFQAWMQQLIDMVRETQPEATIYLLGNLHISKSQDGAQPAMDNINTNDKNLALSGLADGETVFYLDANQLFCDEEGYLRDDITFDGYHLYAANYVEWADYLRQHAVIR